MAVENIYGVKLDAYFDPTTPPGAKVASGVMGTELRIHHDTVEVNAAASATSTYTLARINSNDRIMGLSRLAWDGLASLGAPTLDIGLYAVNSNITSDADALNDGLDAATANAGAAVIKDKVNYGKRAWEYVAGVTSDPGGQFDVKVALLDADVNVGGTITLELVVAQG